MSVTFGSKTTVKTLANAWLSLEEASVFTGYSVKRLRQAYRDREIAISREGERGWIRVSMNELNRWMKSREIPASRVAVG